MADLQYIGARYVPKFFLNPDDQSNDWKSGVDYEPLTIVTYNNDSYTSKIVVPDSIGNPADNPQYWACTTKYTAALMALQSTVGMLDSFVDIDELLTTAQTVSGAINELKNAVDKNYLGDITADSGKFIGGYFSNSSYANAMCFDGEYFYSTTADLHATVPAKLHKIDKAGNIVASLDIGYYHANTAVCDDANIYVLLDSTHVLIVDKNFNTQTPITLDTPAKSIGYSDGKYYVITTNKIIAYSDKFVTEIVEYSYTWFNDNFSFQTAKIYKNMMIACAMYPNTIFIYDYIDRVLLAQITVGDTVDGVRMGEIEDVEPIEIDGTFNLFIQGASTINSNYVYNKLLILTGNFKDFKQKRGPANEYYDCVLYVDGLSNADYSLGTSDYPFKSLCECLENTYYNSNNYHIYVDNMNPTIDNITALYRIHPLNAIIEFNGTLPTNNYFRYMRGNLAFILKGSTDGNIAVEDSIGSIDTTNYSGNLTFTNRSSDFTVIGDLYLSYNVNGVTNVTGKLYKESIAASNSGITNAKEVSQYSNGITQSQMNVGNGIRYQKTAVYNKNGVFSISGKLFSGILTFVSAVNSDYNRAYYISGYGAGGVNRTKYGLMPNYTVDSAKITPAVDPDSNKINFTITDLAPGLVRVTYTALGYTPQEVDDSIDITFDFVESP